ncbi:MAG: HAD family hydrolase [Turicibacter sp.]|nr:HAD family hydrolase [Turicibacter sp.]
MKLFASDYDGTYAKHTLKGQLEIRKNIKVTKKWQEAGHLFVFATGRSISLLQLEQRLHGMVYDYIIGLNGGIIVSKTGEVLFCQSFDKEVAQAIIALVKQEDSLQYSVTDGISAHYHTVFGVTHKFFYLFFFLKIFVKAYRLSLEQALQNPVALISVKLKTSKKAQTFAKKINDQFGDEVVAFSNLNYVDIVAKGLSKATGVKEVAKLHEIEANDVYCMGDSFNDIPMFEEYHGLTVPEANVMIKKQAEAIFETVGEALKAILKDG